MAETATQLEWYEAISDVESSDASLRKFQDIPPDKKLESYLSYSSSFSMNHEENVGMSVEAITARALLGLVIQRDNLAGLTPNEDYIVHTFINPDRKRGGFKLYRRREVVIKKLEPLYEPTSRNAA